MIDLSNISLQFSGRYLFKDVNLRINSADRISLVGSNGSGKTSLLKILIGELEAETGKVQKQKRITIGFLPQDNVVHLGKTLLEEASTALADINYLQDKSKEILNLLSLKEVNDEEHADLVHQLGDVQLRLEELDSYSSTSRVEKILTGLGFSEKDFIRLTDEFSGGWQMRIALAKILIAQNDILLLDEPTNHLDIDSLEWLISYLNKYNGALVIVSHDKHFINRVTSKTLEIFSNKLSFFNGNYDAYIKFKEERDVLLVHQRQLQEKKIKETKKFIERFRYQATKAKQVQSRIKKLENTELIELPESEKEITLNFPVPPSSGKVNIELKSVYKSYGETSVFEGIDFKIDRGNKIAFVGPNGAGKSTLANIVSGKLDINSGDRIVGHNTLITNYSQDIADNLNPDLDVLESVYGIAEEKTLGQLRSLLGSFLFTGDDVFKKVKVLSGGEKSRLALAKILLTKSNLIVLDEPTNHLDFSSKRVLQKALINFPGSLILVSHDIDFLLPIVNIVTEIRKGKILAFPGGIEYYLSKREELIAARQNETALSSLNKTTSRKEIKRLEAEKRQKKHILTKDLKRKIIELEQLISDLESEEKELEANLADPYTYSDTEKASEVNKKFIRAKDHLAESMKKWETLSKQLADIEQQFV